MKKVILSIALVVFCMSVQAQVYVGGTLGLSSQKTNTGTRNEKTSIYSISPEIGYKFNDASSLGFAFSAALSKYDFNNLPDEQILMFIPYYRNVFAKVGNIKLFSECQLGIGRLNLDDSHCSVWGANLGPGIIVDLSDKVQLIGRSTLIQYLEISDDNYSMSKTGLFINNSLEVGIIVNL